MAEGRGKKVDNEEEEKEVENERKVEYKDEGQTGQVSLIPVGEATGMLRCEGREKTAGKKEGK